MLKSITVALLTLATCLLATTELAAQAEPKQKQRRQKNNRSGVRGRMNRDSGLRVGQVAPTFKLKSLDGKTETDLTVLRRDKPVVLMFGSYT